MPGGILWMDMSRNLNLLSCSKSSVNVWLKCMELKSLSMDSMSVSIF